MDKKELEQFNKKMFGENKSKFLKGLV